MNFRVVRLSILIAYLLFMQAADVYAAGPASDQETKAIQDACISLGLQYAEYLDMNKPEKIARLFADNGTFEGTAKYMGPEDIHLAFSNRPKDRTTLHLISNQTVEVVSKNLALSVSNFVVYKHDGKLKEYTAPITNQPFRVGRYHDECILTDNGWRFQTRKLETIFLSGT